MKTPAILCLALLGAGCVTFRFERTLVGQRPAPEVLVGLRPLESTLDDALRALGAPLLVWELPADGKALAWGWRRDEARGVSISVPLDHGGSASASYDDEVRRLHGIVLLFSVDGRLVDRREGFLGELRDATARKRPAPVDSPSPDA